MPPSTQFFDSDLIFVFFFGQDANDVAAKFRERETFVCGQCLTINHIKNRKCEACNTPKPGPMRRLDSYDLARMDTLEALERTLKSKHFNASDVNRAILYWHIANLEYGCADEFSKLSLEHWDQDDAYGFEGTHLFLKEGYSRKDDF